MLTLPRKTPAVLRDAARGADTPGPSAQAEGHARLLPPLQLQASRGLSDWPLASGHENSSPCENLALPGSRWADLRPSTKVLSP